MLMNILATVLVSTQVSAAMGYLGIDVGEENGRLIIQEIASDSPALRVVRTGDVLLEVADIPITTAGGFASIMNRTQPGERITIVVDSSRGRESHEVILALPEDRAPTRRADEATVTYSASPEGSTSARSHLVLSAHGPGAGDFGVSIGGAYSAKRPFIDFRYLQGLVDVLSLDIALQTYGVQNHLDLGLRFHLVSGDGFSLALRTRLHEEHYLEGADLFLASASPGILLSFGTERMQWTVGTDAHLFFFAWVEGIPGEFGFVAYGFRPHLGFEFAITDSMNILVEAQVRTFQLEGIDTIVEPGFAAGFSW